MDLLRLTAEVLSKAARAALSKAEIRFSVDSPCIRTWRSCRCTRRACHSEKVVARVFELSLEGFSGEHPPEKLGMEYG